MQISDLRHNKEVYIREVKNPIQKSISSINEYKFNGGCR